MENYLPSSTLKKASRLRRVTAYFVDILPIVAIVFSIYYYAFGLDKVLHSYLADRTNTLLAVQYQTYRFLVSFSSLVIWSTISVYMDSSAFQGTWGKQLMGIKVTDYHGNRICKAQSMKRNVWKFLGTCGFFIGALWVLFDKYNRGVYDKVAETMVVRKG